jgi:Putative auto-transporter adhesin, head GIN domain
MFNYKYAIMKKIFLSMIMANAVFFATAQKTIVNDANAEKRNIPGFTGIRVSNAIDLYLTQGDEDGIAVSASETKYRDRIRTEVKDGVLKIWYDKDGFNWNMGNKKMRAYVSFKNITQLHASGASDVFVNGTLKATDLVLDLSGASDFKGDVDIVNLKATISGASDITASGKVGSLVVDASGASDFRGYDLVAQTCDADASGASDIKITVDKELNARASGASDIRIKGNGVIRKMSNSGASSVKKI